LQFYTIEGKPPNSKRKPYPRNQNNSIEEDKCKPNKGKLFFVVCGMEQITQSGQQHRKKKPNQQLEEL